MMKNATLRGYAQVVQMIDETRANCVDHRRALLDTEWLAIGQPSQLPFFNCLESLIGRRSHAREIASRRRSPNPKLLSIAQSLLDAIRPPMRLAHLSPADHSTLKAIGNGDLLLDNGPEVWPSLALN